MDIEVRPDPSAMSVVMDGHALPARFSASFSDDQLGTVELSCAVVEQRVVCTRFSIAATTGHPELLVADLRDFPLLAARDQAVQIAARPIKDLHISATGMSFKNVHGGWADRSVVNRMTKRRRPRVTDDALRRVVELVEANPKGDADRADAVASRAAYAAIRDEFEVEQRSAKQWVQRARDRGLL